MRERVFNFHKNLKTGSVKIKTCLRHNMNSWSIIRHGYDEKKCNDKVVMWGSFFDFKRHLIFQEP
jgi:hypothetical protein